MALSINQKSKIYNLLSEKIEKKIKSYGRETISMPFLARLIQDSEKIAAYSFMHSISTSLGLSIYEDVSIIIASENSDECFRNFGVGGVISPMQSTVIKQIITNLRNGSTKANIEKEKHLVLNATTEGGKFQKSGNIADFYMKRYTKEYFFEIKTVKPNIDIFEKSKTKLLEWVARRRTDIDVFLVFPYNPYHPKPYDRFTMVGMMDHPNDFLIGSEYWDFLGGPDTFIELLNVFDEVGMKYKNLLRNKFKEIAELKIDSY